MKKFCLHDYIDTENDRGQEFERTKNYIMFESVHVSGYYVDDGSETIKDGEPVYERWPITECTEVNWNRPSSPVLVHLSYIDPL